MQQFISRDAAPSNRVVTASVHIPISCEETKHTLILELYDLEAQNLQQYRLPLPELAVSASCPDLTVLLPTSTLHVWYPSLPRIHQNSTIPLVVDLILKHAGKYEVVKRVEGIDGSEQRRMFTVEEETTSN
jgi:hypothetical protein